MRAKLMQGLLVLVAAVAAWVGPGLFTPLTASVVPTPSTPCATTAWSTLGPWQPAEIGTSKAYEWRTLAGGAPPCAMQTRLHTRDDSTGAVTIEESPLPVQLPTRLLTEADLLHQGSFTIPLVQDVTVSVAGVAPQYCTYTNGKIAFNPAGNGGLGSLFVACHEHSQTVMEISIPALGGEATILQAPRDPFGGKLAQIQPPGGAPGTRKVGGMWVIGNQLILTAYVYYDADPAFQAVRSHFVRSTNLSDPTVVGPFTVGTGYGGKWAGFFTAVPSEWQATLGCTLLNGVSPHAIASIWSWGPAAACVSPADLLAGTNPTSAIPVVYYPNTQPLANWDSTGPLYNGTTELGGMVCLPNTATCVFGGKHGMGPFSYQGGATAAPYEPHLWFYNLNDFVSVKSGAIQPHVPRPYRTARIPVMGEASLGGLAYASTTGRVYATENLGDGIKPRFHVYLISGSPTPPPTDVIAPTVTSFTATPLTAQVNTAVALAASATDNVGVTTVDFTVNGVVHTVDASAPYTATWTPTVAGSYTLRAIARDAVGNQGLSTTLTATITSGTPPPTDTTPPVVSVSATPATFTTGQSSTLTAVATDNVGVVDVAFLLNDQVTVIAVDAAAPYTHVWTPGAPPGAYTVFARARDAAGNMTTSAGVTITVNPVGGPVPVDCVVSAFGPWSAWVPISATEEQRTRTRSVITPAANGGLACPPLTETETRPIVTPPPPDTTAPLVSLSAVATTTVGVPITLTANATDGVGVVGVRFLVNSVELVDDTSAPYTTPWTPLSPATYTIVAHARDAAGNIGVSNSIAVGVTAPPTPGPGPAVSVTLTTSKCRITIPEFSGTPDGNPGWKMQILINGASFGSADISDPYASPNRTREVGLGTYVMTIRWTKTGQTTVFQALGTFVCAP